MDELKEQKIPLCSSPRASSSDYLPDVNFEQKSIQPLRYTSFRLSTLILAATTVALLIINVIQSIHISTLEHGLKQEMVSSSDYAWLPHICSQ